MIPYDKTPFEDHVRDVDLVFDVIGGDVHARSYQTLKRGGMMVSLVAAPFEDQSARYGVKLAVPQVLSDPAALAEVVALVAAGKLKPGVEHVLPLRILPRRTNVGNRPCPGQNGAEAVIAGVCS